MALGEILRNARVQKGLTPSDVAENTRMLVQVVESLEREDFRRIAAPIYGRGFIKLYAEMLELDPEPLIRDFMELYDGSRMPAVRTKKVETNLEQGAAIAPVPVTRTVSGPAPLSPQRQPVQPRPAVRPLSVPEEGGHLEEKPVSVRVETQTETQPVVTEEAFSENPESFSSPAKEQTFPKMEESSSAFVVEPEEPYIESDEPDLFQLRPPRRKPDEAQLREEGASTKGSRAAQKQRHPIFKIGGRMEELVEQVTPDHEARARQHARIQAFMDGFGKLRDGIGRKLPDIVSQKQLWAFGGVGVVLLVLITVGVHVLFKVTGTNVKYTPGVVIERIAPPPALYVD